MLLLILIIFSIITIFQATFLVHVTQLKPLDEIYDIAETGDLVYFRWKEVVFSHEIISPFTHIGLIVIHPETKEKLIVETHLAGDTSHIGIYKGGINIYPLKLRLSTYEGHAFLTKLKSKPLERDSVKFWNNLKTFKSEIPFHDEYAEYFTKNCLKKRLCKNCFDIDKKEGMFCSEFIGFALKQLNMVPQTFNHECLAPGDFRYIKNDKGEYLYGDIVKVKNKFN